MQNLDRSHDPEQNASSAQVRNLLEQAVLELPEHYRTVVMLRDIEELSTAETADVLDLTVENVKIRLHRGHEMIRNRLFERVGTKAKDAFPFMGIRCDRVVRAVFCRIKDCSQAESQVH
jgi:RNA polymerase sigma-70 factor (ECF subfamily)